MKKVYLILTSMFLIAAGAFFSNAHANEFAVNADALDQIQTGKDDVCHGPKGVVSKVCKCKNEVTCNDLFGC